MYELSVNADMFSLNIPQQDFRFDIYNRRPVTELCTCTSLLPQVDFYVLFLEFFPCVELILRYNFVNVSRICQMKQNEQVDSKKKEVI